MSKKVTFSLDDVAGPDAESEQPISPKEADREQADFAPARTTSKSAAPFTIKETAPAIKSRISIGVTDDGKLDIDSLKPANRARVEEVFRNSKDAAQQLGLIEKPKPAADSYADGFVDNIYYTIGGVEALVVSKVKGLPLGLCSEVFGFDEEELKPLREPTKQLLAKYGPAKLLELQPEIQLVIGFGKLQLMKIKSLDEAVEKYMKAQEAAQAATVRRPQPVQSAPVAPVAPPKNPPAEPKVVQYL